MEQTAIDRVIARQPVCDRDACGRFLRAFGSLRSIRETPCAAPAEDATRAAIRSSLNTALRFSIKPAAPGDPRSCVRIGARLMSAPVEKSNSKLLRVSFI